MNLNSEGKHDIKPNADFDTLYNAAKQTMAKGGYHLQMLKALEKSYKKHVGENKNIEELNEKDLQMTMIKYSMGMLMDMHIALTAILDLAYHIKKGRIIT